MQDHDARIVRGAVAATALAAPLAIGIGWLTVGPKGALGAGIGMAVAAAFFSVTLIAVAWAGKVWPELMLPVVLATYLVKLVGMGIALITLGGTTAFDRSAFALAVVGGSVVYLTAELRLLSRARVPYVTEAGDGP
jgi:ATP synthase protein I